jgi:hypothetical protein
MSKTRLDRRTFLRGALATGGVALALPALEAMYPSGKAMADGLAKRPFFGIFYWANGLPWHAGHGPEQGNAGGQDLWTPAQQGEGYTPSPLLEPLARHRVNVATGMTPHTEIPPAPPGQGDGHMRGFMVALTGDRVRPEGFDHPSHTLTALRPSLDQYVARHPAFYGAQRPALLSLEAGVSDARFHDYGHWNAISYNGPDSLNQPILQPSRVFDRLFGGVTTNADEVIAKRRRVRMLDAVLDDARALRGRLGAADRQRLEAHLDHLNGLQNRLSVDAMSCIQPNRPVDNGSLFEKAGLMGELIATAIRCDITRVFSLMLTSPASTHVFDNVGVSDGMHKTCHDGGWESVRRITQHQMEAMASFLDAFNAPGPDGAPLIDQGVIYATSEYGEGWQHSNEEMPALLIGGAGGKLKRGVHTRDRGGNMSKIQLTALQALGLPDTSFGFNGGETSDTVSGFLV